MKKKKSWRKLSSGIEHSGLTLEKVYEFLLDIFKKQKSSLSVTWEIYHSDTIFAATFKSNNLTVTTGVLGFLRSYVGGTIIYNGVFLPENQHERFLNYIKSLI